MSVLSPPIIQEFSYEGVAVVVNIAESFGVAFQEVGGQEGVALKFVVVLEGLLVSSLFDFFSQNYVF
jgi:hypothetical protein